MALLWALVSLKGKREVYFEERRGFVATDIYDFEKLVPGIEIVGPGVIETPVTTIVLNPGDRAMIDQFRDVMIFLRPKG